MVCMYVYIYIYNHNICVCIYVFIYISYFVYSGILYNLYIIFNLLNTCYTSFTMNFFYIYMYIFMYI